MLPRRLQLLWLASALGVEAERLSVLALSSSRSWLSEQLAYERHLGSSAHSLFSNLCQQAHGPA